MGVLYTFLAMCSCSGSLPHTEVSPTCEIIDAQPSRVCAREGSFGPT